MNCDPHNYIARPSVLGDAAIWFDANRNDYAMSMCLGVRMCLLVTSKQSSIHPLLWDSKRVHDRHACVRAPTILSSNCLMLSTIALEALLIAELQATRWHSTTMDVPSMTRWASTGITTSTEKFHLESSLLQWLTHKISCFTMFRLDDKIARETATKLLAYQDFSEN